ncbi:MAG: hypothetical protein U0R69_14005 [Gaiellales bacterium]
MPYEVPSLELLREQAAALGVQPTDDDLERVQAFLTVLFPQFEQLEALVPQETVPAGLYLPLA